MSITESVLTPENPAKHFEIFVIFLPSFPMKIEYTGGVKRNSEATMLLLCGDISNSNFNSIQHKSDPWMILDGYVNFS